MPIIVLLSTLGSACDIVGPKPNDTTKSIAPQVPLLQYHCLGEELSIFLTDQWLWVGTNVKNPLRFEKTKAGYDWESLTEVLQVYRGLAHFSSTPIIRRIQVSADDDVQYGEILRAMDSAIAVDFTEISYVRPEYQYANFTELTRIPSEPPPAIE